MLVLSLLVKLLPIYALVGLGWLGGRLFEVKSQEIGKILLFFLSPAVIFKGFYQADLDGALIAVPFVIMAISMAVAWAALFAAGRLWGDGRERILAFTAATGNTGYFGIPAVLTLVGPEALPYVVMVTFGAIAYEVTLGYYIVNRSRATAREALKRVLAYPGLHAAWLGLLLNAAGTPLPAAVMETVNILTGAYSPLGMMIVGIGLASLRGAGGFDLRFTGFAFAAKFLLWPALAFAFVAADRTWWGLFPPIVHQVLIVESLVPMAAMTVVHATLQNVKPEQASLAVGASTVFALAYLPLGMVLAERLF